MEMEPDEIAIPKVLWDDIRNVLDNYWFHYEDGECFNNQDVINICNRMDNVETSDE